MTVAHSLKATAVDMMLAMARQTAAGHDGHDHEKDHASESKEPATTESSNPPETVTQNQSGPENQTGGGPHSGTMHAMSPFLFTRSTEFFILFESAFVNSTGGFVGALFASFAFAILATLLSQVIRLHETVALAKQSIVMRIVASVMHGFRQLLHYAAMLIVMTMNVWIILAVVAGHAVGWMLYAAILHNKLRTKMPQHVEEKATDPACDC